MLFSQVILQFTVDTTYKHQLNLMDEKYMWRGTDKIQPTLLTTFRNTTYDYTNASLTNSTDPSSFDPSSVDLISLQRQEQTSSFFHQKESLTLTTKRI